MDILESHLEQALALIQLQEKKIEEQSKTIKHLEELLKHKAYILEIDKD